MRIARTTRTAALTAALLALTLLAPATAGAATLAERAAMGAGYIVSQQEINGSIPSFSTVGSTADAVVALVAAQRGPTAIKKAMRFLSRRVANDRYGVPADEVVGAKAKVILAVVASGGDPGNFGGKDLVAEIQSTEQLDGRYGANNAVFNQASAILALHAAGAVPSTEARGWLVGAQCGDGGWAYDAPPDGGDDTHCTDIADPGNDWFPSDTNTTSLVVQALAPFSPVYTHDPMGFFDAARDGLNGWGYSIGGATDANSTAMVIQAYKATGTAVPTGAMAALKALQYRPCGAFHYSAAWTNPDVGATVSGILGLLKMPLHVDPPATPITEDPPASTGCPA